MLRRENKPEKKLKKAAVRTRTAFSAGVDSTLWEALRARRLQLAKAQGVPPYVVFHDATLAEMVEQRPQTLSQFAHLSGVGERKLAAYGEDFLEVIRAHARVDAETEPMGISE